MIVLNETEEDPLSVKTRDFSKNPSETILEMQEKQIDSRCSTSNLNLPFQSNTGRMEVSVSENLSVQMDNSLKSLEPVSTKPMEKVYYIQSQIKPLSLG